MSVIKKYLFFFIFFYFLFFFNMVCLHVLFACVCMCCLHVFACVVCMCCLHVLFACVQYDFQIHSILVIRLMPLLTKSMGSRPRTL